MPADIGGEVSASFLSRHSRGCGIPAFAGMTKGGKGPYPERPFDLVVEDANAGLQRAQSELREQARGEAVLAERGGAIILGREHAFVEQGPALLPMVFAPRASRGGSGISMKSSTRVRPSLCGISTIRFT